jgi:hypothetical protein
LLITLTAALHVLSLLVLPFSVALISLSLEILPALPFLALARSPLFLLSDPATGLFVFTSLDSSTLLFTKPLWATETATHRAPASSLQR